MLTLSHPNFYGHPVEIDHVEDDHLLGFHIDHINRTVTFQQPAHSWQLRDPQSAGAIGTISTPSHITLTRQSLPLTPHDS